MKLAPVLMFATLLATAGAVHAAGRVDCPERGRCAFAPPVPPVPPVAPAPPMPPMPPLAEMPAVPEVPSMAALPPLPPLPAPPLPPPMPKVPKAAHASCAGKPVGSEAMYSPRRGVTMTGTCERDSKGMYFDMRTYSSVAN
jgi:hypothetical protein